MTLDEALGAVDKLKDDFLAEFGDATHLNAQERITQFLSHLSTVRGVIEWTYDERVRHGGE